MRPHTLTIKYCRVMNMKSARRDAQKVLAIRIIAAGLAYVTQILLARALGGSEYGVFATVWVWMTILGHSSLLGFGQSACLFIPRYQVENSPEHMRGFMIGGALFVIAVSSAIALIGALSFHIFKHHIAEDYILPLKIAMIVLPFFALQDFMEGIARAFKWPMLAIAPPYIVRQIIIVSSVIIGIWMGAPKDAWVAVAATLIGTIVTLLFQMIAIRRALKSVLPITEKQYAFKQWVITALPMGLSNLMNILLNYLDVLVLSFFVKPAEVGVYFAASRLLQIIAFIQYAASTATSPRISHAYASDDHAMLQQLVTHTARLTTTATMFTAAGLIFASPWLLWLFGTGFEIGTPLLMILSIGLVAQAVLGPAEDTLNMCGEERIAARITCVTLIIALTLSISLIPLYGIWGAAWTMALTQIIKAGMMSRTVYQLRHIGSTIWGAPRLKTSKSISNV